MFFKESRMLCMEQALCSNTVIGITLLIEMILKGVGSVGASTAMA